MPVNITVITFNRLHLTKLCLESLLEKTRGDFRVHVVDNASTDGTQDYVRALAGKDARVRLIGLRRNMGLACASNMGWEAMDADYCLKMDNDILVQNPLWLQNLVDFSHAHQNVALLGYKLGPWKHQETRMTMPGGSVFVSSVCCNGGCVLIPRRIHEAFGFWCEDYGKYGFEDIDYSRRTALKGYYNGYLECPAGDAAPLLHLGEMPELTDQSLEALKEKALAAAFSGERMYILNNFLYSKGVRPPYMPRKYLPVAGTEPVEFRSNPAYGSVVRLQQDTMGKLEYAWRENGLELDLRKLKD